MLKTITSVANTVGSLEYKGLWNAATNTPTLVSSVGTQGDYYVVSVAGTTNLDGVTTWDEGDWAIFNGSVWQLFQDGQDGVFATLTVSNYAAFADNAKATFGTGAGDLEIYHDGNNSYVSDTGTGGLYLKGSNEIALRNASNGNIFLGLTGGSAYVYHNGSAKLSTTATGIDITGTATMDGLLVEGETAGQGASIEVHATTTEFGDALLIAKSDNASNSIHAGVKIQGSNNPFYIYQSNGSNTNKLRFNYNSMSDAGGQMTIDSNGDISFFDPTGTTPKFFWDASAESLGIGTSSPQELLHLAATAPVFRMEGASRAYQQYVSGTNFFIRDVTAGLNRVTLDSSGNLGIGTSSPATALDVVGTVTADGLTVSAPSGDTPASIVTTTAGSFLEFTDGNTTAGRSPLVGAITDDLAFYTSAGSYSAKMTITASGNVGIGTSSPSGNLEIATSASDTGVDLVLDGNKTSNGGIGSIIFNNNGDSVGMIRSNRASADDAADMLFYTQATGGSNTERARLTSDGNFLVGKTSSDLGATAGIELSGQYDVGYFTRSGDKPLVVNRLSSDGTILDFRRDGTSVGFISSLAGTQLIIDSAGDRSGIRLEDNALLPRKNSAMADGTVSLGSATYRFKDLYLSGGVVFGTTGGSVSSKTLDDYETGTWTPVLADAATAGNTATMTADGRYTKIGRLITVECRMLDIDTTGMTAGNNIFIRGLPEVVSANSRAIGSVSLDRVNFTNYVVVVGGANTSYALLSDQIDSDQDVVLTVAAITSTGSDITFTLQYTI
jgi:hypothetical protein